MAVRRRGSHNFVDNRFIDGGEVVSLTHSSHVGAGLNTSTVALRIVDCDEKGTQCLGI
jgi:hypothetical protein